MRKITALAAAAALFVSAPAMAGGMSVEKSFDIGASGSALSKGGTSGGTYAKGKNGSDAYSFSENFVTNTGKVVTGINCGSCGTLASTDTRTSTGWGESVAETSGKGAVAEAFSERSTFGKSKIGFDVDIEKSYSFGGGSYFFD
jgi:hypothetical protein